MLDAAQEGGYAYPAINCSSIPTLNAALKGFANNKSDGIIQFSTGAGQSRAGARGCWSATKSNRISGLFYFSNTISACNPAH